MRSAIGWLEHLFGVLGPLIACGSLGCGVDPKAESIDAEDVTVEGAC